MPEFLSEFLLTLSLEHLNLIAMALIGSGFIAGAIMFHLIDEYNEKNSSRRLMLSFIASIISFVQIMLGAMLVHWIFNIRPALL